MRTLLVTLLVTLLSPLLATCVAPQPRGDISFLWSFAGETSCLRANVDTVDVFVIDDLDRVFLARTVLCQGGGLTLLDFPPGRYTLLLDAFSSRGQLLYEADVDLIVSGGVVNDLGFVGLSRAGEDATGDLAFDWSFAGETSCSRAGVDEVDVRVDELFSGDTLLLETADCAGAGLVLLDLPPERVEVFVDAYDGRGALVYLGNTSARVAAGEVTDLGLLELVPAP